MHDIDRVRLGTQPMNGEAEGGQFEQEAFAYGPPVPAAGRSDEVFDEAEQLELASELLEIGNEAELDHFLGSLVQRAAQALGGVPGLPGGRSLAEALKIAAKQILPAIRTKLGKAANLGAAARAFGLELEGLSNEDREFEIARRFIGFAGEALRQLAAAPAAANPRETAQAAITTAARMVAPGLMQIRRSEAHRVAPPAAPSGSSGRWVRHGGKIVLYGA
jgi:hypothetical protein